MSFGLVYVSLRKKNSEMFFSGILKEPFPPRKLNVVVNKLNSHYLFWIYDIA